MSKLNEQAQSIFDRLGEVKIEDGLVSVENHVEIDEILKERAGVTDEQLEQLASGIRDVSSAYTDKIGRAAIGRLNSDDTLAELDYLLEGTLVDIGVHVARPTVKDGVELTSAQRSSCIGSRVTFKKLDSTLEVIEELGNIWDQL